MDLGLVCLKRTMSTTSKESPHYRFEVSMKNWFNTLNEALESENIIHTWDISFPPIAYGQSFQYTYDDGTKYGRRISIYRDERGMYERPVHYSCN